MHSFLPSRMSSVWREIFCASVVYAFCIALFFYPTFGEFTTALIGPPEDNMQDLWNTWYSQIAFASDLRLLFFSHNIFFPEGTSLVYHSFSYVNLFCIFLVRSVFGLSLDLSVLVGLHNLMLLVSFYFGAMGAFVLTRQFTQHLLTALVGGYIFAFSPFHFAHALHHIGVATIQYIPFFVLMVLCYMKKGTILSYIGSVAFFVLGALSCWYFLFYNAYFLIFYYAYCAIRQRTLWLKATGTRIVGILLGAFLTLSPLIVPMMIEGIRNRDVYTSGHNFFVADLAGFFVFHPYHLLSWYTQWVNDRLAGNPWEMSVYLGLVNIGLLVWAVKKRSVLQIPSLGFCLGGMIFFMLIAGGSSLHILGKPIRYILLPTAVTEYLPFVSNVRTPSRAIVYTYLFLAIAIGCILKKLCFDKEAWCYQWQRKQSLARASAVAICALLFVDFYSIAKETTLVDCPKAYESIVESGTHSYGVLDMPTSWVGGNQAMMYQICHQKPIVHASISRKPASSLIDALEFTDLDLQRRQLADHGVRYIVVHKYLAPKFNLTQYAKHYRTVYSDERNSVFAVDRKSETRSASHLSSTTAGLDGAEFCLNTCAGLNDLSEEGEFVRVRELEKHDDILRHPPDKGWSVMP